MWAEPPGMPHTSRDEPTHEGLTVSRAFPRDNAECNTALNQGLRCEGFGASAAGATGASSSGESRTAVTKFNH